MLKVKDVYETVLEEVTCNLRKVLNESVKSIKKVLKVLESARKFPPAEDPHHAETNHPTLNANKLTGCNKRRAENQRRPQNRPKYHKYFQFYNANRIIFKISNIYSKKESYATKIYNKIINQSEMSLLKRNLALNLLIPSRHLPAQSQQQKHQNKAPTTPTANNKDTSATPLTSPRCLHRQT